MAKDLRRGGGWYCSSLLYAAVNVGRSYTGDVICVDCNRYTRCQFL